MKPYKLFLLTSVLFSVIILTLDLSAENNTVEITIHDTYFIIAKFHVWLLLTLFLGMLTSVYFILYKTNRTTINILTYIHYSLTLLPLIAIRLYSNFPHNIPRRYYTTTNAFDYEKLSETAIYFILLIVLCIGQFIFIINILTSRKNYVS